MSVAFMAMLGSMILLPLYLQDVRGLTPLQTGLLVMPGGLAMGLLGPRVGACSTGSAEAAGDPGRLGVVLGASARSPRSGGDAVLADPALRTSC